MPPKKKASKGVSKDDAEQVLLDYINKVCVNILISNNFTKIFFISLTHIN